MNGKEYHEFLQSKEWKAVRDMYMREHKTCNMCGRFAEECHHFKYEEGILGYLNTENLRALCRSCHREVHLFDKLMIDCKNNNETAAMIIAQFYNMIDVTGQMDLLEQEQYNDFELQQGKYMYKLFVYAPNARRYASIFTLLSPPSLQRSIREFVAKELPHPETFLDSLDELVKEAEKKTKTKARTKVKEVKNADH